jgi:hypothetical protein
MEPSLPTSFEQEFKFIFKISEIKGSSFKIDDRRFVAFSIHQRSENSAEKGQLEENSERKKLRSLLN